MRLVTMTMAIGSLVAGMTGIPAAPRTIEWQPCAGEAQCGSLTLPVDWDHPGGATFQLAVARRPATDPAARVGTLIFGPGGPGDSGVDRILDPGRFSDDIRRHFDIVSFDPRGVQRSNPIVCPDQPAAPGPVIADQADFDRVRADNLARWQQCRTLTGPIFDHADTASTVRDLDALRAALGERKLTFHGSSYGTLLGEEYAERYPGRVRAVLLESVMDHSLGTAAFLRTQAWALQDSFDAFVDWCDRNDACGPDVRARWNALRTDQNTFDLAATAHINLYGPDYPALATFIENGVVAPVKLPPAVAAVFCADWSLPVRDYREYQELTRQAAAIAPDLRLPAGAFALPLCLGWPQPVANPQHRLQVHTTTPLLLLNSRHDPADGYNWAVTVARQLGRHGVLLTLDGAGHASYTKSTCMRQTADRYLISLVVPPRGTVCHDAPF